MGWIAHLLRSHDYRYLSSAARLRLGVAHAASRPTRAEIVGPGIIGVLAGRGEPLARKTYRPPPSRPFLAVRGHRRTGTRQSSALAIFGEMHPGLTARA